MPEVNMPKLSDTMEEGTVVAWKVSDGSAVKKGDVIAEVESDKASFEINAEADGPFHIVVEEGKPVAVGAVIAQIGGEAPAKPKAAEAAPAEKGGEPEAAPAQAGEAAEATREPAGKPAGEQQATPQGSAPGKPAEGMEPPQTREGETPDASPQPEGERPAAPAGEARLKVSPVAARLAAEKGVDLRGLKGSGPEGRIVKEDVLAAAQAAGGTGTARPAPTRDRTGPEVEREELSRMQTIVARRMVESKTTVPHFYLTTVARMDEAVKIQQQLRQTVPAADKLTISDLVMRACALALLKFPEVNASWADDHIERKRRINIGFAVAQAKGLVVPVVKDVDSKDLVAISIEARQLIERARAGKPAPQDLEGGTFSISNLGMFGITEFAAVINRPEAAILAVGAITDQPVAEAGQVVVGKVMKMTLSVDHRVLYGADGARFLAEVRRLLESPVSLVLPPDLE